MANIKDGTNNWPCTFESVKNDILTVVMAGEQGYHTVTTGKKRKGVIVKAGDDIIYEVILPGGSSEGESRVIFKRKELRLFHLK